MLDLAKKIAPLTAVVFVVLSATTFPLPFEMSHTMAAWVALGALAVHVVGAYLDKPKA